MLKRIQKMSEKRKAEKNAKAHAYVKSRVSSLQKQKSELEQKLPKIRLAAKNARQKSLDKKRQLKEATQQKTLSKDKIAQLENEYFSAYTSFHSKNQEAKECVKQISLIIKEIGTLSGTSN